jgi:hypothetical protein
VIEGSRLACERRFRNGDRFGMAAVEGEARVAASAPNLCPDPVRRASLDDAGEVAPRHAREHRPLHLPLDVLDIAGVHRRGADADDGPAAARLGVGQVDEGELCGRIAEGSELQCAHDERLPLADGVGCRAWATLRNGRFRHCRDAGFQLKVVMEPILAVIVAELADHGLISGENRVLVNDVVPFRNT